jgi:crotonobetainyl-CoA:carnitine CoA-transferase CaiB-like acyl-CoA transferase
MANMAQLTTILDEVFAAQPMGHWYEIFSGVHVTFGAVRGLREVIDDLQLAPNNIVVPLEGAGGKLYLDDQQPHSGARRRQGAGAPSALPRRAH